jgi:hypothetical protein
MLKRKNQRRETVLNKPLAKKGKRQSKDQSISPKQQNDTPPIVGQEEPRSEKEKTQDNRTEGRSGEEYKGITKELEEFMVKTLSDSSIRQAATRTDFILLLYKAANLFLIS